MMKKLLAKSIDSVTAAAFLVGASSLVSRLLGVVRDRILASSFGAGDTLDIYYAAFRIPDLIFNLLVLGALSAGFIPAFTNMIKDDQEGEHPTAWRLTNNILNLLGLTMVVLMVLGIVFAPWLMKLVTPGFSGEKLSATVALTRIMFLSPLLLGLSSVLGGVLQSMKRFLVYSLSPIFYNLGIIFGAYFLVPRFGVWGLAWGVVLGSLLHAVVQIPTMRHLGWRYQFIFDWRDKGVRLILRMMTARTLALAINQINLVIVTVMASLLASGSLTIFNLANNLQSFAVGIFGISFAIAVFPALSAAAFDKEKLIKRLAATARQILFFIIPSTVIILLLKAEIVRVILGSGRFDWQDTILTMNSLSFFAISFFAQALIPLFTRVFYARHDSKTPFYIGLAATAVNIALSWWLGRLWGVAGLALAFSLSSILNFIILVVALKIELGSLRAKEIII
ncbi:MAG: murein biosynthesis integral membrane protein MurJ, partial [Ignavibacteria bacterium]|nr:murein biosynthesis integral membrane protein MurJ [Ignavibacteria bacterium]